ncbi:hypothetical protein V2O64_20645 [Verrucomicrobiaceae bacterium 227]
MTLAPTLNGGLKLIPEERQDWLVLLEITADSNQGLAREFGELMDEDSMWDEIVVPELEAEFSTQRKHVLKVVKKAQRAEDKEVVIEPKDADLWYGALNQARLSLEAEYKFGPREFADPEEIDDPAMRSAFLRDEFYLTLQSLILRYVSLD